MHLTFKKIRHLIWNLSLHISLFICVLGLQWSILASFNFGYAQLYDTLNIKEHIEEFGPQNKYKVDFATTSDQERISLFGEIVQSIHQSGKGLEKIAYHNHEGIEFQLLRIPEIIHLQDVAHLLDLFFQSVLFACLGFSFLCVLGYRFNLPLYSLFHTSILWVSISCILGGLLLIIGPVKVFYWLHTVVFPSDHQWFFYYQESLMTTLMKAPDLFGAVGLLWFILSMLSFIILYSVGSKYYGMAMKGGV